ncbi:MAG TPA: hypothetical protein VLG69_01960, partial [Candidatus Andersenbacteria bacterium]|nr:hypothetical protein [Candidatus Andersenbacteria bacterium]
EDEFRAFCFDEENPVFEFWNKEHIQALGSYLAVRAQELGATEERPIRILEVGAGSGKFNNFLWKELIAKDVKAKLIPTDSMDWNIEPSFPVIKMNAKEALGKFAPDIVISSWMPNGKDWTYDMRQQESVREYILIGDEEMCGSAIETWGRPNYDLPDKEREEEIKRVESEPSPWEKDGFSMKYLREISKFQLCRVDIGPYEDIPHSSTHSFRRN